MFTFNVSVPSSEPCATKTLSSDSTPQTLRKRDIVRRVGKQFVEKVSDTLWIIRICFSFLYVF